MLRQYQQRLWQGGSPPIVLFPLSGAPSPTSNKCSTGEQTDTVLVLTQLPADKPTSTAPHTATAQRNPAIATSSNSNSNSKTMDHSRPPLRLDRAFFEDRNNQLKLAQMMTGAFALLLTSNCYPNTFVTYCAPQLFNFLQLFTAVCVNGFFLVATTLFALAHLFSIPDAFYHYNFPLLEKFYTTLATVMYAMGVCITLVNVFNSLPSLIWIFQVGAICAASLTYLLDCWRRWRVGSRTGRRTIS